MAPVGAAVGGLIIHAEGGRTEVGAVAGALGGAGLWGLSLFLLPGEAHAGELPEGDVAIGRYQYGGPAGQERCWDSQTQKPVHNALCCAVGIRAACGDA